MVDLLVYTNHRMGDMYCNTPFPHNVLSIVTVLIFFWGRFFFREVRVNDDIAVKLIVLCSRKCLREEIDSRGMFNIYLLDPYWSQKKRIPIRPSFGILLAGWKFFIYSFSFEKYESDLDRVIYLRSFIVTFCWSENQIDVSSHLMKRNPNRSSHFDEAKFQSMY